ncbi:hypothetical protein HMPREF0063_12490 [Aeromicrobium marinum DSM 15272]|uniref:Uncharacterized protein n=1 Tax=Aeromicrobium marinum DSM 15272 TaxID=585531 RepID=E2SEN1_9ACTN|nr:hypothetical protein [Aeromicrobium marinum]EFQ82328.1 hypothetical protein HMPREF0063_12490 [Aeromicrobium marinum DSM 15272]
MSFRWADASADEVQWLVDPSQPWQRVVAFGPQVFAAYARVRFIPDPLFEGQLEADALDEPPLLSEAAQMQRVVQVLLEFTASPREGYACVWDGWGEPAGAAVPQTSRLRLPHREYFTVQGSLVDLVEDWTSLSVAGSPPRAAFIWPADQAWCIACDVDPHWAGVGGSTEAIQALIGGGTGLDAVTARPGDDQPRYR